MFVDDKITR